MNHHLDKDLVNRHSLKIFIIIKKMYKALYGIKLTIYQYNAWQYMEKWGDCIYPEFFSLLIHSNSLWYCFHCLLFSNCWPKLTFQKISWNYYKYKTRWKDPQVLKSLYCTADVKWLKILHINVILISMVIKVQYWLLSNFDICLCSSNVS
jgi:hypothetical protein